jgi:hypothetical protein
MPKLSHVITKVSKDKIKLTISAFINKETLDSLLSLDDIEKESSLHSKLLLPKDIEKSIDLSV